MSVQEAEAFCKSAHVRLEITQHMAWLRLYVGCMSENNWRDMRDRMGNQLNQLDALLPAAKGSEP